MKRVLLFFVFALMLLSVEVGYCRPQERWIDISSGIDETDLKTAALLSPDPDVIYAGSMKSVFKSTDGGKAWQKLYLAGGANTAINIICIDPQNPDIVYAGTQSGLFKSADAGKSWDRIFEGIGEQARDIRHMVLDRNDTKKILIGTGNGLFISIDSGNTWNKQSGELSNQVVNFIALSPANPDMIYIATSTGVLKSVDVGATWERVFTVAAQTEEEEMEESAEDTYIDETEIFSNKIPNCIVIDTNNNDTIYLGTNAGVFLSADAGKSWQRLPGSGLINNKITSLVICKYGSLCAATQNGIFKIQKPYTRWEELYSGLLSKYVNYLVYNPKTNMLFAATKKGIYKTRCAPVRYNGDYQPLNDPDVKKLLSRFESEPTIQEIQQAAIKYAEVNKGKIDAWRRQSRAKAILPSLSVSTGRYLTDYYHWDAGLNPDVLQKGKSAIDWDVTVSWDLGDLVWSTDQTSIDARSRLMVQLRNDILNEVTHLYFERRKLQIEFMTSPPKETNARLEKILRLQELTAGVDALTGGYLSKRLAQFES